MRRPLFPLLGFFAEVFFPGFAEDKVSTSSAALRAKFLAARRASLVPDSVEAAVAYIRVLEGTGAAPAAARAVC